MSKDRTPDEDRNDAELTPELLKKFFDSFWEQGEAQDKRAAELVKDLGKWKPKNPEKWTETDHSIWGIIKYSAGQGQHILIHPKQVKVLQAWWDEHLETDIPTIITHDSASRLEKKDGGV